MSKIVLALGGNALGKTPEEQLDKVTNTAKSIVELIKGGNDVVVSHGNGPQVGMINLAMDFSCNNNAGTPAMPFAECGAMSQGYIGYHLQQAIQNELKKQNIQKNCITVITQVEVSESDKAFSNPTKPVGMFYTKEQALEIEKEKHYQFVEDAGRGYRRVVPSPKPVRIVELDTINKLVNDGNVVIAIGGGGVPVVNKNGLLSGVAAVIDKDLSSARLAIDINADKLVILTAVDKVSINYNTKEQQDLDVLSIQDANKYISENQFAKGSMLPKVEACMQFVKNTKNEAIITSLLNATDAINGKSGTKLIF